MLGVCPGGDQPLSGLTHALTKQKIPGEGMAGLRRWTEDKVSPLGIMPFSFFRNPLDRNGDPNRQGGCRRFHPGRSSQPRETVHPEMAESVPHSMSTPKSPNDLIAMQGKRVQSLAETSAPKLNLKIKEALALISRLNMTPREDAQVAVYLICELEEFHRDVLKDVLKDQEAGHDQVAAWAIDADRLMQSGMLLESATLPEHQVRHWSVKTREAVAAIGTLNMEPGEDAQIALWLIRKLEEFHRYVLAELKRDKEANHDQIAAWATDAERLMQSGILLESVDLG